MAAGHDMMGQGRYPDSCLPVAMIFRKYLHDAREKHQEASMKLSVIIPVHNGGEDFYHCLEALTASTRVPDEIIVVDDTSSDASAELAGSFGAQVLLKKDGPHGPAVARNCGARIAAGDVLVFIDADVAVHADTLAVIEAYLQSHAEIAAIFGSYDDTPPKPGLVTRYKNLQHHFVHQHGAREASTFWAGCGAMRRDVFLRVGGFNESYSRPSIEDIELGTRLSAAGYRTWLCADIQVTHVKRWTFVSLLRADIFERAVPWTRLILTTSHLPADLNLDSKGRLSALMAWLGLASLALGCWFAWALFAVPLAVIALIFLNFDLYRLFEQRGGLWFALGAFGLHTLYLLYSSLTFATMLLWHASRRAARQLNIAVESRARST